MFDLDTITAPTLLLDGARARANIAAMAARAQRQGVRFRPHFKTHQSAALGEWFRAVGVQAITVSSVRMARYFANAGWSDILIAFPTNLRELPAIAQLAARVRLGLLVESTTAVDAIAAAVPQPVDIWLEVDTGYARSGIEAAAVDSFTDLLRVAAAHPHLCVRGLLTHSGQTYAARGVAEVHILYLHTLRALTTLRAALAAQGWDGLELSIGDTPTCSMVENLGAVDEMRPGNFVFYDWMQHQIGACREDAIAVAVACPVVASYPARREVILYGGAVHLAKDFVRGPDGALDFGHAAPLSAAGWGAAWPGVSLRSLSQEHGILHAASDAAFAAHLSRLRLGDLVAVLPIHSCLTADLHKQYLTLEGETVGMMGDNHQSPQSRR